MEKLSAYLLGQADKLTAWIGFLGLGLYFVGLHSLLVALFVALIALPETHFSEAFKGWTAKLRQANTKQ